MIKLFNADLQSLDFVSDRLRFGEQNSGRFHVVSKPTGQRSVDVGRVHPQAGRDVIKFRLFVRRLGRRNLFFVAFVGKTVDVRRRKIDALENDGDGVADPDDVPKRHANFPERRHFLDDARLDVERGLDRPRQLLVLEHHVQVGRQELERGLIDGPFQRELGKLESVPQSAWSPSYKILVRELHCLTKHR